MMDFYKDVTTMSPVNVRDKHKILMGPWVHGGHGTARVGTDLQGQLSYPNAKDRNDTMALKFFDFYLRNVANGWEANAKYMYYQMGENKWQTSDVWPPAAVANTTFYLHQDGELSLDMPTNTMDSLTFSYDPSNPSPTVGGCNLRNDLEQGPYDQKTLVEGRSDILVFTTPVFNKPVVLKGRVKVRLKVGSDRPDTDFDIRLTDVYPDGRSMLVNDAVFRMRFRNGFSLSNVAMMSKGGIYDCVIDLPNTSLTFLAGHRIRIDVSSSNYPKYNRNMNNGNNMYPGNSTDSLLNPVVANNTVYLNANRLSSVVMPLSNFTNPYSITDVKKAPSFQILPNPASNIIELKFSKDLTGGDLSWQIFDIQGRLVGAKSLETLESKIDIEFLAAGVYTLILHDGHSIYQQQLVKQSN
jgi:putative CocE/NonD family hydrolase